MPERKITVVVVEPGNKPKIETISASLEGMQKRVGGYIQAIYPFEEEVAIICNEEAKLEGLPLNRSLSTAELGIYDIIAGTFFIASCNGERFGSLSDEQQLKYKQMFLFPEKFSKIDGKLVAIKYDRM